MHQSFRNLMFKFVPSPCVIYCWIFMEYRIKKQIFVIIYGYVNLVFYRYKLNSLFTTIRLILLKSRLTIEVWYMFFWHTFKYIFNHIFSFNNFHISRYIIPATPIWIKRSFYELFVNIFWLYTCVPFWYIIGFIIIAGLLHNKWRKIPIFYASVDWH